MSQDAQDGPPPPYAPDGREDDPAATPLLGSPYPDRPAPAIEFGQVPADATEPLPAQPEPVRPVSSATVRDAPKAPAPAPAQNALTVQDIPLQTPQRNAQQVPVQQVPVQQVPVQQPVAGAAPAAADDQATQQFAVPPAPPQAPPQPYQEPYQEPQHPQQQHTPVPQAHPVQPYQTPVPQQFQTPIPPQGPYQAPAPQNVPARPSWHRQHYAIGVFLVVYGLTNLATGLLGFSNHRRELAGYIGEGMAGGALLGLKAVEGLILVLTIAGLARRKDVWFLPSLLGWVAGFAAFAVFDVVKGKYGPLLEHGVYAALFFVLLVVSHGLSAKVRRTAPAPVAAQQDPSVPGLSRTQEIALNALTRWQRQQ
ncbi:hypothetical protein [Actinocorallia longicatena]|uniref:Membrane protein YphA (DoxX/SURF4 family) n=1 Tax=Actinocorallia longicatena TaxID=111803 RepID=A0ABP6Q0P2_9ACTN